MKNLKEIKSTIVGTIMFAGAGYAWFGYEDPNYWAIGVLGVLGLGFLFAKDTVIRAIERILLYLPNLFMAAIGKNNGSGQSEQNEEEEPPKDGLY